MMRYVIIVFLSLFFVACQLLTGLDDLRDREPTDTSGNGGSGGQSSASSTASSVAGAGGNTTASTGLGGMGGDGGQGGQGASSGTGGQGGAPPCETGIYAVVVSNANSGNLGSTAGNVTSTTFEVYGTDINNKLDVTLRLVNNLSGDFTVVEDTLALEKVRIRCQDPNLINSYSAVCDLPLIGGEVECEMPGCYSNLVDPVKVQIQVNPSPLGAGEMARVGIDPNTFTICGGQADIPTFTIN